MLLNGDQRLIRARVEKATAIAHARQRVTFNPEAELSIVKPHVQKPKRRVSLGIAVNAETGEVIEETINAGGSTAVTGKRQSKRRHTMMNTTATFTRMKDAEVKKVVFLVHAQWVQPRGDGHIGSSTEETQNRYADAYSRRTYRART